MGWQQAAIAAAAAGVCFGAMGATVTVVPPLTNDASAWSAGYAINDSGQVTGITSVAGGEQAFVWSKGGSAQALGDLAGGANFSSGQAINNAGTVAGSSSVMNALQDTHAFGVTAGGTMQDLGAKPNNGYVSYANGINEAGDIVGLTGYGNSFSAYVLRSGGTMTLLGKAGGLNSRANDVNDSGWIAGDIGFANGSTRATVWTGNTTTIDLGDLAGGANYSTALALNDKGMVVGNSGVAGGSHAFLWTQAGGMVDLGDLAGGGELSMALAINEAGVVVGSAADATSQNRAVMWKDGLLTDLNSLLTGADAGDWVLAQATGINESNQIVGWGWYQGQTRGFLLDLDTLAPVPDGRVPEPATWALVLVAAAAAARGRQSRACSSSKS